MAEIITIPLQLRLQGAASCKTS